MTYAVLLGNGITITSAMICMSYLYRRYGRDQICLFPPVSVAIIGLTFATTALQFVFPAIVSGLQRDLPALRSGEWWRIVSPLLIQPQGWFQCVFNGAFLVLFLPLGEKLFGKRVLALYLASGIVGQVVNYVWRPYGGGASTGIFGVIGAILVFACRHRKEIPKQYLVFALFGLSGAVLLSFVQDGHGPALLAGAVIAAALRYGVDGLQPEAQAERPMQRSTAT